MSKAAALLGSGVGLAGASAAGTMALKSSGPQEEAPDNTLPQTLSGFKDSNHYHCLKEYFPDLQLTLEETNINNKVFSPKEIGGQTAIQVSFFQNIARRPKPKSCLAVNWDRENYSNGKWTGNFRWLWTFVHGTKGFLMFNTAETSDTKSQLNLFGGLYFLKKEKKNWIVHKYKELKSTPTNERKIDVGDFEKKFPVVGDISKDKFGNAQDNWGFMADKNDLTNICGVGKEGCSQKNITSRKDFTGIWEWESKSGGSHQPQDWSKNFLLSKLPQLYSDITNIKTVLTNGFNNAKGTWTNKILEGNSLTS